MPATGLSELLRFPLSERTSLSCQGPAVPGFKLQGETSQPCSPLGTRHRICTMLESAPRIFQASPLLVLFLPPVSLPTFAASAHKPSCF